LKEHLPACISKYGSIDLERFKGHIIHKVDFKSEGYELKFLDKNYARLLASIDKTAVFKQIKEHNEKEKIKTVRNFTFLKIISMD
jgi:type III restriction enzyme/adenine-specific DNA-methyltransferase